MAKILIVDDNEDLLQFLAYLLKRKGNEIEPIFDGSDLYRKIQSFIPDIILMDVKLTGVSGRELCRQIKSDERTRNIKIILMSASPKLLENYSECEADAVIEKPFDIKVLLATVENFIEHAYSA